MSSPSIMSQEAASSASVIEQQLTLNQGVCERIAARFQQQAPRAIMMIGRGTSDHAGVFGKYLFEVGGKVPVFAAAPSVAGVFDTTLQLDGCVALAISQSGKSPDILHQMKLAKAGGAFCLALVNDTASPLAQLADEVVPLCAGPEKAVAATKSYMCTLSALCQLTGYWQKDMQLLNALKALPDALRTVQALPAKLTATALADVQHCVVLGRGFGYAIAREIALKLKEVLGVHAESFSSAEFLHGPVTLVEKKLAVINVSIADASESVHNEQVADVGVRGGRVIDITVPSTLHPRLHALEIMQRFYLDIEQVAVTRGLNPDTPPGLKKVTETR